MQRACLAQYIRPQATPSLHPRPHRSFVVVRRGINLFQKTSLPLGSTNTHESKSIRHAHAGTKLQKHALSSVKTIKTEQTCLYIHLRLKQRTTRRPRRLAVSPPMVTRGHTRKKLHNRRVTGWRHSGTPLALPAPQRTQFTHVSLSGEREPGAKETNKIRQNTTPYRHANADQSQDTRSTHDRACAQAGAGGRRLPAGPGSTNRHGNQNKTHEHMHPIPLADRAPPLVFCLGHSPDCARAPSPPNTIHPSMDHLQTLQNGLYIRWLEHGKRKS